MAPSLQHLHVIYYPNFHYDHLVSVLPKVPWEQLLSLSLSGVVTFDDALDILLQCERLENCSLHIEHNTGRVGGGLVQLRQLTSLQIHCWPTAFLELPSLILPNLTKLTINMPHDDSQSLEKFAQLMDSFKCTLRVLELTFREDYSMHTLDEVLHTFPFITHLIAGDHNIILLDTLIRCGQGLLLPNIEALEFWQGAIEIEDIVNSLIPDLSHHLKDLYIHTQETSFSWPKLEQLHSEGINVWAVYSEPHILGVGPDSTHVGMWLL